MTTTLEPMRWWHVESVAAIERAVFGDEAWSAEQFWGELAQPTRRYLVACDGGAVVGFAGLFVLPPDADVQTIAVSAAAQGHGLGRRLLDGLIALAASAGANQLMLEVRADNAPAIALYERRGFERLSVRRDYYAPGADALIMRLRPIGGGDA